MLTAQNDIEAVTLQFMGDWSLSDPHILANRFTEDGFYHNIPAPVARGRENIRALLAQLFAEKSYRMENLNIASRDRTVYVERIDHITFRDGSTFPLPVFGVLEFDGELIAEWREYFDYGTLQTVAAGRSAS